VPDKNSDEVDITEESSFDAANDFICMPANDLDKDSVNIRYYKDDDAIKKS